MRWAQRHGTSIIYPEGFPLNTLALMRGAVGYQLREGQGRFRLYVDLIYRAIWQRQIDLRDAETLAGLLRDNGFDPDAFLLMVAEPEIKQALIAATEAAVERGVFGAPTFFVDGVMHFGQDRMDWVEAEASGN